MNERVEVYIPRGADREDPNFFVAVNGVNYASQARSLPPIPGII